MISQFEEVINSRVASIKQLIGELETVSTQNTEMTSVREDIQRVKIAIDLAKRDILQKKQVS